MRGVALAAILLSGCSYGASEKPDDRICETAPDSVSPGDMKACVHRWAYRLAGSRDPAKVVAEAVVDACNDVANYYPNGTELGSSEQDKEAYRGALLVADNLALFRVVQARAGNCAIP